MLMNVSSDTLYKLSPQKRLTPIFTRTPSVYASKLRNIWMPLLTTDKFMLFGTFVIDFKVLEERFLNLCMTLKQSGKESFDYRS